MLKLAALTLKKPADSQIDSQGLFLAGHNQSGKGTDSTTGYYLELPSNERWTKKINPVKKSWMVRGTGFEPVTSRV
jgi:hypothetical protein